MKIRINVLLLLIGLSLFFSSQYELLAQAGCGDSVNVELTKKFRFLGDWNRNGLIDYKVVPGDTISEQMAKFVENTLPETIDIFEQGGDLFDKDAQLNTVLIDSSDVWLTLVHEGANFKNVLGFYTYEKNDPPASVYDIDSLTIIFPKIESEEPHNVTDPGDKVYLGAFPPNTVIGYFVISDGWVGDTICYLSNYIVFTDKQLNTFTKPEYSQHTIQMFYTAEEKLLLGFEDWKRPDGDQDFNDVMFYISANPDAIDTADIVKVPTAKITGDTVLCDPNAPAQVQVDLTGKGPWTIVYFDGRDSVEIESITSSPYLFTTEVKNTIKLVSVRDRNMHGTVSGAATISVSNVSASFLPNPVLCEGDPIGQIGVSLEGYSPWTITYSEGDKQHVVDGIVDTVYYIDASLDITYRLIGVADKYCVSSVSDTVMLTQKPKPTAEFSGYNLVGSQEVFAELLVDLTGSGPWYVFYEHNGVVDTAFSETASMVIPIKEGGTYILVGVTDAYCTTIISNGSSRTIDVDESFRSKAILAGQTNLCGEGSAWISVALTGKKPLTLTYSDGSSEHTIVTEEDTLVIGVTKPGLYKLISVYDVNNFYGTVEGEAEIISREIPTAEISGHSAICGEHPAELNIELTGSAPWMIVYTDGSQEYGIESSQPAVIEEVTQSGNYQLVSVQDAYCPGTVSGSAEIQYYEIPTATISGGGAICTDGETVDIIIDFTGAGPW